MKGIIFDMDGVIINSEPVHFKIGQELLKGFGGSLSNDEQEKLVGTTDFSIWTKLKKDFDISMSVEDIIKLKKEKFLDAIENDEVCLVDGVIEFIKNIDKLKYRIGLASSNNKNAIERVISKFKLEVYIDFYISGEDVSKGKPDPEIFLKCAEKLCISRKDCIVIEDAKNGVQAAKSADMYCIGYKNPDSGNQDLSKADFIINSFEQLKNINLDNIFNYKK